MVSCSAYGHTRCAALRSYRRAAPGAPPCRRSVARKAGAVRWCPRSTRAGRARRNTARKSLGSWLRTSRIWPALTCCATAAPTAATSCAVRDGSTSTRRMSSRSITSRVTPLSGPGGTARSVGWRSEGSCAMRSSASSGVSRRTTCLRTTSSAASASSAESRPARSRTSLSKRIYVASARAALRRRAGEPTLSDGPPSPIWL